MLTRFAMYFRRHFRAPIMGRLWACVILVALYSLVVCVGDAWYFSELNIQPNLHALMGGVLGMLLVFRTNTAYDRWWEGRKLWGQLVNDSRNLTIKVRALVKVSHDDGHHLARLLVNFARALKEHLREGIRPKQLSVYRNIQHEPQHVPAHVANLIREKIGDWKSKEQIDGFDDIVLDVHVRALMDICGACERIRKTPISRSYLAFIRQSIFLYLSTLPWGLVHDFTFWTIPAVTIIAYFMIGIELIAEQVEEPFGREEDDLELDVICQGIETTVMEIFTTPRERMPPYGRVEQIADQK